MKIGITKGFKFNMGNYESMEVDCIVVVEDDDLWDDPADAPTSPVKRADALADFARDRIKDYLDPMVREAARMSQAKESILPDLDDEEPAPARRERTRITTTRSTR